jgi:PIN domain nuclease of toxin-antitoxin system
LDTHSFLWFAQGDAALSLFAKSLIEEPTNRKLISIASCWEIAIKAGLGKLRLGETSEEYIKNVLDRTKFELLPISLDHATKVETLPLHHRDPFDRLLVAQSLSDQMPILSADPIFAQYGVQRLW